MQPVEITLAHSPDSDDAFMFYALATRKIPTDSVRFAHTLEDIQSLNMKAQEGVYDVTAVSFHAYPYIAGNYVLLPCGASFGDRYGPIIVAKGSTGPNDLKGKRIAVPGKMTTAYLVLKLFEPDFEAVTVPFDQILAAVAKGEADAGVVIHEGQLTYGMQGLSKVVDLGEWWYQETGLPLPLGGNVIRRSLGLEMMRRISATLRAAIRYSLDHREEALAYAMQFARGLDHITADKFVSMYVNHWTLGYGAEGRQAVQTLLDRGFQQGVLPQKIQAEFVDDGDASPAQGLAATSE
ncbi:MAG: ABC transporter substrate-binding protein [Acidobacteriota bacterium]|nr:ABC transporter substrate-binding protein [Acidobacteriota bacterium]